MGGDINQRYDYVIRDFPLSTICFPFPGFSNAIKSYELWRLRPPLLSSTLLVVVNTDENVKSKRDRSNEPRKRNVSR